MKERLVVIDDNPNDALLVRRFLEKSGYDVRYANSGEEGLRLLRQDPADCVLVDYRMPGMDGYEVSRQLKEDDRLKNIPVLMLTGADSPQHLVGGLDAGADDFVTKSAEIDVILARVRAALRVKAYQDRIVTQAQELRRLNDRFNNDLQFARRVQEALLPQREFETAHAQIRSAYIPSETLSGDFYDYFRLGKSLYLFVADVSGHGLPAAILVSLLKSFLHSEAGDADSLAAFMASLNDFLATASLPTQFATGQLLRLDEETMQLVHANAAHPPFLLFSRRDKRARIHETPGHLLGALPGMRFDEHTLSVEPGDLLFTYTDGLTDRKNRAGDFYAIERIAALLETSDGDDIAEMYARIYDDVTGFDATEEFRDDLAFVLTRFR